MRRAFNQLSLISLSNKQAAEIYQQWETYDMVLLCW
jgi:hypothetical protein